MLVFIDESGDCGMHGKQGSSRIFAVTAVLFEDNGEAEGCDRRIHRLKSEMKLSERFEFHFNSCNDRYRTAFLQAVSPFGFFYHSMILNKAKLWGEGFKYKNSFYKYAASLLFENAKPHLLEAKVILDECGNRDFMLQLAKYLKKKMNDGKKTLIKKVCMEPSHSNNLLQLADMVSGAIFRSFDTTKPQRMAYRRLVAHRELGVQVWPK